MITVEKLVYQGYGLARLEGKTIFVRRAAPGDRVEIQVVEHKKNFDLAQIERLIEPSPARVSPPCIFYQRGCGGCQWQHLDYQQQLEWKRRIFIEFLERSRFPIPYPEITIHRSEPYHYRTRFQFHLTENGKPALFREHSHALVEVDYCWLLPEPLNSLLAQLHSRSWLAGLESFQVWIDDSDRMGLQTTPHLPENLRRQACIDLPNVMLLGPLSQDRLEYTAGGVRFQIGEDIFFQTNRFLNGKLNETIRRIAGAGQHLLDLYSGAGFFALPLSRNYEKVIAIEESLAAVEQGRATAALNGITNTEFFHGSVEQWMAAAPDPLDTVIADPPRAGLSRKIIDSILSHAPQRVIYVSCDPATLVRDIGWLRPKYSVKQFHLFDMFPQTFHFEVIAELQAREGFINHQDTKAPPD